MCGTGINYCQSPACLFQYGPACDANQIPPGTNTTSVPRPRLGSLPYGQAIYHCTTPGHVALTFDDGPYIWTGDLLDILKTNNVKATFFIVGNNNGKGQINDPSTGYPAIIQRMYAEGHQIASHTWSHQDLSTLTHQQRMDQIVKNEMAFVDILGFFPTYLRPPYESCNGDCLTDLGTMGYHVMNYDVDTLDWQENYPNSQQIFLNAIKSGKPATNSFIPLTHDIHNGTVHGFAQFMIDNLKQMGYTTVLVGDCLQDPSVNWYRNPANGQGWSGPAAGSQASASPSATNLPAKVATTASLISTTMPTTTAQSASSAVNTTKANSATTLAITSSTAGKTNGTASSTARNTTSSTAIRTANSTANSTASATKSVAASGETYGRAVNSFLLALGVIFSMGALL